MYKVILALRYLLKRRITWLAVAAVALCVFVALVVMTVLGGLAGHFKVKIHNFVGDCVVSSRSLLGFDDYEGFIAALGSEPSVRAVAPVIRTSALVKARGPMGTSAEYPREIIGLDPNVHFAVTGLAGSLTWHKRDPSNAFVVQYDPSLPGCMSAIGILSSRDERGEYDLPGQLPCVSFEVTVLPLTSKGTPAKAATDLVNTKTYWLSDAVDTGLARVDWSTMYLPFAQAQMLSGMNLGAPRVTAIYIRFADSVDNAAGCRKVEAMWKRYLAGLAEPSELIKQVRVESWELYQRDVVAAVETEQKMMSFIIGLLGIITVFIVFVVFYMLISHKSKDIGILKSLGASTAGVSSLFLLFGLLVGVVGAAIGAFAGWQFLVHINDLEAMLLRWFNFQLWNRRLYVIDEIPNAISERVLLGIVAVAIIASVLGALAPSIQGARRRPVQSLQVNQL